MHTQTRASTARLLEETLAAHSAYEATALDGAYDENWSEWYAAYLLEHGLPNLLPPVADLGVDGLGALLRQLDGDYRRQQPQNEWPAYYAERLVTARL